MPATLLDNKSKSDGWENSVQRRNFISGAIGLVIAGPALATGHDNLAERVASLGTKVQRQNTIISNVNFIINNAKAMTAGQLVKAYAYLKSVQNKANLSATTYALIERAKQVVREQWKKFGTLEELEKKTGGSTSIMKQLQDMQFPSGTVGDRPTPDK